MIDLSQRFRDQGVRFIFDPGQSLPIWDPKPLARAIEGSHILISNDYELALIKEKTGLTDDAILRLTDAIITTKGEAGLCNESPMRARHWSPPSPAPTPS